MYINTLQGKLSGPACRCTFHTHAGTGPGTCGAYEIDKVLSLYKELGYDCMCISNHNIYTAPGEYEKRSGILLIPGYEYTKWEHMVCLGTDRLRVPHPETYAPLEDPVTPYQEAIDSCNEDGGYPIVCHPNWPREWAISKDFLDSIHGFRAIEVHNVQNGGNAFDYVLNGGRLVWGIGSDDFHRWRHLALAWNMVYAPRDKASIMEALKRGEFYATTGLRLEALELERDKIYIRVLNKDCYYEEFNYKFIGNGGEVLKEVNEEEATYRIKGTEKYIRVEVTNNSGFKLYTQPIYDDACVSLEKKVCL